MVEDLFHLNEFSFLAVNFISIEILKFFFTNEDKI
jgi:hypothetical protein